MGFERLHALERRWEVVTAKPRRREAFVARASRPCPRENRCSSVPDRWLNLLQFRSASMMVHSPPPGKTRRRNRIGIGTGETPVLRQRDSELADASRPIVQEIRHCRVDFFEKECIMRNDGLGAQPGRCSTSEGINIRRDPLDGMAAVVQGGALRGRGLGCARGQRALWSAEVHQSPQKPTKAHNGSRQSRVPGVRGAGMSRWRQWRKSAGRKRGVFGRQW